VPDIVTNKDDLAVVEALERRLLEPGIRSSRPELELLLADDFVEFGSSGRVWTRKEIITDLLMQPTADIEVDSIESRYIGEGTVLITYRSRRVGEADAMEALRSSIWQRRGGTWKIIFHQGTKARA